MSKRESVTLEAQQALQALLHEIAIENGRPIINNDFGEATSYQCGSMVKKVVEMQERKMVDSMKL